VKLLNTVKFLKFWFPALFYSGIIFYVSSVPNLKAPLPSAHFDKVWHMLEYLPLGVLLSRALIHTQVATDRRILYFFALLICIFYGISDEFHQAYVPGRSAVLSDVAADSLGALIGIYFYSLGLTNRKRKV
jgi:VanZ family protein